MECIILADGSDGLGACVAITFISTGRVMNDSSCLLLRSKPNSEDIDITKKRFKMRHGVDSPNCF